MAPAVDKVADVKYQGFHDAVKQLKGDGKLKYAGIANHGSFNPSFESREPMDKVLLAAAEDGRYDIFLMVYNHLNHDQGDRIMRVCKDKGIGVTLMKSNPVGTYFGMKESIAKLEKEGKEVPEERRAALAKLKKQYEEAEGFLKKYKLEDPAEIMEAAIKFCLNNPNVGSVVLSLENFEDLNRYVKLSGTRLTSADAAALDVFSKSMGQFYCRHACGICEDKCPHAVPVSTIMRFNHYFAAQGREKYAMEQYAELPAQRADQCQNCSGYCESACPYNVPIHTLLTLAHQNLTLA
jgi:predicted aldo/keto reductase-like oxidoreductase